MATSLPYTGSGEQVLGSANQQAVGFANSRYLVVLADRQNGKFFTIYGNSFEDLGEEILDRDVPQKIKNEGRPGKISRHIRDHLYKHLKHVGKSALDYLIRKRIKGINGVIIGGHKELLKDIEKFLPARLRNKIVGHFIADTDLSIGDLTRKAKLSLSG